MLTLNDVVDQYWNIIVLHHLFCNKNKSSSTISVNSSNYNNAAVCLQRVLMYQYKHLILFNKYVFFMKVLSKMISLTLLQPIFRDWVIHTIPFLLKWFNHVFALHLHQFKVQMLKGHTYLRMPFSKMSPPYWR